MRIYQMEKEAVADLFDTNLELGSGFRSFAKEKNAMKNIAVFLRGFLRLLRSKFYYVNIIAIVCYAVSFIFSWLNHSWNLMALTISAIALSVLLSVTEAIVLYFYKKKYNDRNVCHSQKVKAIRSGEAVELDSNELIAGDLICLEPGSILYCDARIVESKDLFAEEKTVFGATIPVEKNSSAIAENNLLPEKQKNMLWKGSYITAGFGRAIVSAVGDDCYIEKTGGRKRRKQRSFFYNKHKNIGRIASYVYIITSAIFLLFGAIITNRYVEAFLLMAVLSSLMALNPVSSLTEWTYYRMADRFYRQGILIRNIEAFDGMNKERDLYFDADDLVCDQMRYSHSVCLQGTEKSALSYFSLCMGKGYISNELNPYLEKYNLNYEKLEQSLPVFRRETDQEGNSYSLFSNEGRSVIVSAGYWKEMMPYIQNIDDALMNEIFESEAHGKMVYLLASDSMAFIPNRLDFSDFKGKMSLLALVIFDLPVKQNILSMIGQLKHSSMKVHLISAYSDTLSKVLASSYDMDDFISDAPPQPSYSCPKNGADSLVVYKQNSSPIDRDQAMVVLESDVAPQQLVYRVKCMFCGIKRCLNFLAFSGACLILTVFTLFMMGISMEKMIFSMLFLTVILLCPCYYLIESVRNCNQYRRSLILGMFCGSSGFIAALISCDIAIFAFALSTILLSGYLLFSVAKHRAVSRINILYLSLSLLLAVLPVIFTGGYWLPATLLALFPPLGSFVLDLFY